MESLLPELKLLIANNLKTGNKYILHLTSKYWYELLRSDRNLQIFKCNRLTLSCGSFMMKIIIIRDFKVYNFAQNANINDQHLTLKQLNEHVTFSVDYYNSKLI